MYKKVVVLVILFFSLSAFSQSTHGYSNPVIRGFYPDPSVCRVADDYYLVCSSFEYFPGLPLFHSKDLIHWEKIGYVINRESQLSLKGLGLYAPTIRYNNGTFYVVCTNVSGNGNFIVSTRDIHGQWSDPINIEQDGIDPSLFFDANGKVYLTTNGNPKGIYMSEIDVKTGKLLSPRKFLTQGTGGRYPEGPHIYKKDGWYYLMLSEGGTEYGHMVNILRSRKIWGPYQNNPANPILTHRNDEQNRLQGTGHADIVQAHDGSWWTVFLAFRTTGKYTQFHHLGRETCLLPVTWEKGKWPEIYDGRARMEMNVNTLPQLKKSIPFAKDEFNNPNLGLEWNFLREYPKNGITLSAKKGWLGLTGSEATLDSATCVFTGIRQTEMNTVTTTKLDFVPLSKNEEAGLTVYMNKKSYYSISVGLQENQKIVKVTARLGNIKQVIALENINSLPSYLRIDSDAEYYYFKYSENGSDFKTLAKLDTRYLSSEVAGGFTGVYLGLFATGNGVVSKSTAFFDWFYYKIN